MVYTAIWVIICYLPPTKGTRNNHWFNFINLSGSYIWFLDDFFCQTIFRHCFLYQIHRNFQRVCFGVFPGVPFLEAMLVSQRVIRQPKNFGFGRKKTKCGFGFQLWTTQLMVNCWLGLVVWIRGISLWKGLLLRGIHRIPNHRVPNQQLTISWTTAAIGIKKKQQPWICDWPWCLEKGSKMMIPWRFGRSCSFPF